MSPARLVLALPALLAACAEPRSGDVPAGGALDRVTEDGLAIEAPLPPQRFLCDDGRTVSASAYIGGVYLTVDDRPEVFLPEARDPATGLRDGFRFEGEGLGWDTRSEPHRLADLAPGQTLAEVQGVACRPAGA